VRYIYYNTIDSTQKFLVERIKNSSLKPPVCVWSEHQTGGIGSRGNGWYGVRGNLFFSFAVNLCEYSFVPLQSISIYFGWLFKKTLNSFNSRVLMKWPNDLYIVDQQPLKIGGVMSNVLKETLICGIGLNTVFKPEGFGRLDIDIKNDKILKSFFTLIEKKPSWESVIGEFKEEFEKTKGIFNINGVLLDDGSLEKNQKRIYSRR